MNDHTGKILTRLLQFALLAGAVETPHEDGHGRHVYHQYTILSDRRDAIQKALAS